MAYKTREEWLVAANKLIDAEVFKQAEAKLPKKVRVSCGFPSVRATSAKNARIGECWSSKASGDETFEILISPRIDEPVRVLDILVHEDIHAIVGLECGHKGEFAKLARKVGLEGKLTATVAGAELEKMLKGIAKKLGKYPHAKLAAGSNGIKKQTTRLIKCVCPETGYVVRTTDKWIALYGPPYGPTGEQMEVC